MIGRRPWPVPSHSLLYKLPPVPRLTRYQRCWCILSQREYILNHIKGDLGPLKYPFRIVVSDRPHLVYKASLQDLLEPTKEVVIAFIYRAKNGSNIFCSHGAFEWTHSRPVQMDGILEGGVPPKSCTSVTVTVNKIVMSLGEECQKWQHRILLSYAPSWRVWMNSLKASLNGWNFGGGVPPKSCTSVTVTVNKIVVALGEECQKQQQRILLSYAPSQRVRMKSLKASLNGWNFGGGVPPKSRTSVTVTVNKIVVALVEECTAGRVTGLTTTTTSKSPGNTTTTMRMTVTINDIMPQGIETIAEREVGNNIVNNGNLTWVQR